MLALTLAKSGVATYNSRPISTSVIIARSSQVTTWVFRNISITIPFQVPVIVVRGKPVVSQELFWIAGSPFRVHHLNVEKVITPDVEPGLYGTDTLRSSELRRRVTGRNTYLECIRVVRLAHRLRQRVLNADGFVNEFDHADIPHGTCGSSVRVNKIRHEL